ncbi:MAG: tRNA (N6-isopentenyl adenosine(37)-C2)-methylthiotransferase MiaB [bacterium]
MDNKDFQKPKLAEARKRSKTASAFSTYTFPASIGTFGNGKTYWIETYGCQGNEADTEKIHGLLAACGFTPASALSGSDLVVFNTCAIRANAENKVFGELGRIQQYRDQHPDMKIAVGGCMPQEETVVEKILKTYHQVDVVFGTHNLHRLPDLLAKAYGGGKVVEVLSGEGDIIENIPRIRPEKHKAWVNIMAGCDEFCTYCIVPYARGRERSRMPAAIIAEVDRLIGEGCQEITLLGQNVNSYGLDLDDANYRFADLLETLSGMAIPRIRFTTSHPKDFSPALITVLAKGGNLMPHIHLPVQSGSDRILKAMNRKYTAAAYLELVHTIKAAIPGVAVTTDIIVGFPGETEADFQMTLDLVRTAGFEGAYTFVFSPRSGTPAASYPDNVPKAEKMQRLYRLNELVNEGFAAGNRRFVGSIVKVLVNGRSPGGKKLLTGYTEHNKPIHFEGADALIGTIANIRVTEAKTWSLEGEPVDEIR